MWKPMSERRQGASKEPLSINEINWKSASWVHGGERKVFVCSIYSVLESRTSMINIEDKGDMRRKSILYTLNS